MKAGGRPSRRALFRFGLGLGLSLVGAARRGGAAEAGPAAADRIIFLGTKGGPALRSPVRLPSATLVVWRGRRILIDAGYGASLRLVEAGIGLTEIDTILITHLHSDHTLDLGPLLDNAWSAGLTHAITVYGPPGIQALITHFWESQAVDIAIRQADEGRPDPRGLVRVIEFDEGPVFSDPEVTVEAQRNLHPPIRDSFAFRLTLSDGRRLVFSGDTAPFPPMIAFAHQATYLIHEAMEPSAMAALAARTANASTLLAHLQASHSPVEAVGRLAAEAEVKTLVLTHLVPGDGVPDETWIAGVRTRFAGPVIIAHDLLSLPL